MAYIEGVVQSSDTGLVLPYSGISDSFGNYASTGPTGVFYSFLAYPGYVLKASHSDYYTKSHTVTDNEIKAAWVTINLNKKTLTPSCCFTGGTRILMADSSEKPISQVKVGNMVMGRERRINRVSRIERPVLGDRLLYSLNNGDYFVTAEHPFRTSEGWKSIHPAATAAENPNLQMGTLKVGDVVEGIVSSGMAAISGNLALAPGLIQFTRLVSLKARKAERTTQLYNLLLDGDHVYFANGFLVHNKNGGW